MNTMKERVEDILNRPMNRQQFLKQAGLLILGIMGVTALLNTLDPKHSQQTSVSADAQAYGGSVYAGNKKPV